MSGKKLLQVLLLLWIAAGFSFFLFRGSKTAADISGAPGLQSRLALDTLQVEAGHLLNALWPSVKNQIYTGWNTPDPIDVESLPPETDVLVFDAGKPVSWIKGFALPNPSSINEGFSIVHLPNGIYLIAHKQEGERVLLVLTRIWRGFSLQNRYLENGFHPALNLPNFRPSTTGESTKRYLTNSAGDLSIGIVHEVVKAGVESPLHTYLFGIWLLAGALLALVLVSKGSLVVATGSAACVASGRILLDSLRTPADFFETELFNPTRYASGRFMGSPGDLLLSVVVLFIVCTWFARLLQNDLIRQTTKRRLIELWTSAMVLFSSGLAVHSILTGLIVDSRINFDLTNITSADGYTLLGLLSIMILLGVMNLFATSTANLFRSAPAGKPRQLIIASAVISVVMCFGLLFDITDFQSMSGVLLSGILLVIRVPKGDAYHPWIIVASVIVCSLFASDTIFSLDEKRQEERMQQQARRLGNRQDMIAEFLLRDVQRRMSVDTVAIRAISNGRMLMQDDGNALDQLSLRLTRTYFVSYLRRYDVRLKYFDQNGVPINRSGDPGWDLGQITRDSGTPTGITGISFSHDDAGRLRYTILVPLVNNKGTVVAELSGREETGQRGMPVLLMEEGLETDYTLEGISYARYADGVLVSRQGDFNYFTTISPYKNYFSATRESGSVSFQEHIHFFSRQGNSLILVSRKEQGILHRLTLFSYLLTFSGIVLAMVFGSIRLLRPNSERSKGLRTNIQGGIVLTASLTLLLIGLATVVYLINNYRNNQLEKLEAIAEDIRLLAEREVRSINRPEEASDKLQYTFEKLSSDLQTDFNLFNTDGQLFYSSQPGIYNQGITAALMNRLAYKALTRQQRSTFNQTESIGKLNYLSAYEPIRNDGGKLVGFLQFPYFDRETELKREISRFLVALINLYVLLFCVAVGIGFIIANRISAPLAMLEATLGKTSLGSGLERIEWKHNDEFGRLITAYNRMLDQLEESAGQLAKSERESAWREMARQVAHEIKNPLTPMKLGVQHLQRVLLEGGKESEEKAARISRTLVEQIDTLSGIATAFGDFARMPGTALKAINLVPLIEDTIGLYGSETDTEMTFIEHSPQVDVVGDKDQLLRILGNLVKNAVQAIPADRKGHVTIAIEQQGPWTCIKISDNGVGIPESQRHKLFVPEFTTKSSGSGLGLAMVKAMAEGMGGHVAFEPIEPNGSRFIVNLRSA